MGVETWVGEPVQILVVAANIQQRALKAAEVAWCWRNVISADCSECQSEEIQLSAGKRRVAHREWRGLILPCTGVDVVVARGPGRGR